ncbi:hypothetical protein RHMOL_Rhmol07G0004700 [Rhododendron molle]|uniref:Uncharacterized protein n=1 Tax=Rhododendron molle TaxID=49168 RepID=A0ACC0MWH9_RHOML|nr:hypothetical protein RHMOL_Rhmol07G0004700 [Rhododendron molle]
MPQACTKCNSFGHYSTGCHLNPPLKSSGQIWKEKEKGHALINSKAQDKAICSFSPLVHKGEGSSTLSIEAYHSTLPQELESSNFLKNVEFEGQEEVSLSGDPLDVGIVLTREEKKKRLKHKSHQMKDDRAKEETQLRLIRLPPKSKRKEHSTVHADKPP